MKSFQLAMLLGTLAGCIYAQASGPADTTLKPEDYRLGPGDQVVVHVVNMDEIQETPYSVDAQGSLHLPVAGDVYVGGMTGQEVVHALRDRLSHNLVQPDITVALANFQSQPVSVLGSVRNPGIHQLAGRRTLLDVLSMAGGLSETAGYKINITRESRWGSLPLPGAAPDQSGAFSLASVNAKSLLSATNPEENIQIKPGDLISVPRADLIYVLGAVKKPGGIVLAASDGLTALQVMALADGFERFAAPRRARILRPLNGSIARVEIPIDLQLILDGKGPDFQLRPNDVLIVPTNGSKAAAARAVEAAIGIGTSGALILVR
jgi:polysaccharide export outer membrane protein